MENLSNLPILTVAFENWFSPHDIFSISVMTSNESENPRQSRTSMTASLPLLPHFLSFNVAIAILTSNTNQHFWHPLHKREGV